MLKLLCALAVFAAVVQAFDYDEFKTKYCYEDTNIKRTNVYFPYLPGPLYKGALVCEDFVLKKEDLDFMARTTYSFTSLDAVIFKNCEIEYLNEYLASKFGNLDEMYFENCNVSLKNPEIIADPSLKAFRFLGFYQCNILDNLKSLAFKKFNNLLHIWIKDSTFQYPHIDEQLFPELPNLVDFLMDNVNIKSVDKKWLSTPSAGVLSSLSCTSCQLEEIDTMFEHMNQKQIVNMYFNDNLITKLPSSFDILQKYNKLVQLHLSGNLIEEEILKRNHLKSLESLTSLDLSRNKNIREISYLTFKNTGYLQNLNMSDVNLQFLNELGGLNLTSLDFSHNIIATIPLDTFANLEKMIFLDLSYNKITGLEESLFRHPKNLQELRLGFNSLQKLPINIFKGLTNLQILDLSYNNMEVIDGLENLINLQQLSLQNNNLKIIPSSLPSKLLILDISFNALNFIGRNTFENLAQLTSLDISHTNSSYIDFDKQCLEPLKSLKVFKMRSNKMTSIEEILLPESLEVLDLEFNKIQAATNEGFNNLTNLKYLNLSYNHMHAFEKDLMTKLHKIRNIDLEGNDL